MEPPAVFFVQLVSENLGAMLKILAEKKEYAQYRCSQRLLSGFRF
jgi:hypothetical protein